MIKALITIIVIIGVAVGIYFAVANKDRTETPNPQEETVTEETPSQGKKMAFSEYVKQKENAECTVNVTVNDVITQGKVYIAGEKIRGEYKTDIQGQIVDTTFISDGVYAYTWSSVIPRGVKVKLDASVSEEMSQFDYTMIGDYTCNEWRPDMAKFVPPTTITFSTIN